MTDPEGIDPNAIARLREWGGDKLVGQMAKLFLANSPARVQQIRAGVEGNDAQEAERGAHSLKSSAANVGGEEVRRIALEMEGAAARGDLEAVRSLMPMLEEAFRRTCTALEAVERGITS
jgi:HPt (histidine-containing phosphotransfer) domain-containing protein